MNSIRARLLVPLLAGPLLVLVVGGLGVYLVACGRLARQLDETLSAHARTLASLVTVEGGRVVCEFTEQGADARPGVEYVVLDPGGEVVVESAPLKGLTWRPPAADLGEVAFGDLRLPDGAPGRAAAIRFRPSREDESAERLSPPDPESGAYSVLVAESTLGLRRAEGALLGALTLVGLLMMATLVGTVWFGVRVGLAPIRRLGAAIGGIAGEHSRPGLEGFRRRAPRELLPVYEELDRMVARVESAIARERRFADAASHELRTPLAELRTVLEVAARWPEPERLLAAVSESRAIGRDMERLVEALLMLDAPLGEGSEAPGVPIGRLAATEVERLREGALSRGLAVSAEIDDASCWPIAPAAAQIIVRNLIANAFEYSPDGGRVSVVVRPATDGGARLEVTNGPVTLGEEDLPRLFEPFWRLDGAREARAHSGLGLSIVRHVAMAAGLRCEADLAPGSMLRMRVEAYPR